MSALLITVFLKKINKKCCSISSPFMIYVLDAVRLSRILIGKQKLGRTFNSDKLGGIASTKISKLTMCSA